MSEINLNDPTGNQILVYNELSGKFENVDLTVGLIQDFTYISGAMNLSNEAQIYNDNVGGTLRFRGIVGNNGITTTNVGTNVVISFNGDATTLSGLGRGGFLQVSNHLGDIDPVQGRNNLNVLSSNESFDLFMEANASNIPDIDNTYDLGSNGRRYANMFAVTFHGNATSASIADNIRRNGAQEGQVLRWRQAQNTWVPENLVSDTLVGLSDVDPTNLQHESVIIYNGVRNKFEMVPSNYFGGGGGSAGASDGENLGDGVPVFGSTIGNTMRFRTIDGGANISIDTDAFGEKVVITADVPQSTSELPEGTNRYYTRDYFLADMQTISIQQLANVDNMNSPNAGQAPVWDGSHWAWRTVSVNMSNTDQMPEGTNNLYFTNQRVDSAIQTFINNGGVNLAELGDVNIAPNNNDFLYFHASSNQWRSRKVNLNELGDVNASGITNGQTLAWSSATSRYVPRSIPVFLEDLQETASSLAFNQASFNTFFAAKTTADVVEDPDYKYLTLPNLSDVIGNVSIGALSDVSISGISNGNILIWSALQNSFIPADSQTLNVSVSMSIGELSDVDDVAVANIQNGQVLAFDGTSETFKPVTLNNRLLLNDDVTATNIDVGDGIVWNGVSFVNKRVLYTDDPLSNGDVLVYDQSNNNFVATSFQSLGGSIFDIHGTSYDSIQNNDILIYDHILQVFKNTQITTELISDIDTTDIQNGDSIIYDAANEMFMPYTAVTDMGSLSDVEISNIQPQQTVVWDGSTYVNKSVPTYVEGSVLPYDMFYYDDTAGKFQVGDFFSAANIDISQMTEGSVLVFKGTGLEFTTDIDIPVSEALFTDLEGIIVEPDVTDPDGYYVIEYNSTDDMYYLVKMSDTGKSNIVEMDDFDYNFAVSGEGKVVTYRSGEFTLEDIDIPAIASTTDLTDVDNVQPTDGQVLVYNASKGLYEPQDPPSSAGTLTGGLYDRNAAAGQTAFNIPHQGDVWVWANGILLPNSELDLTNTMQVVLNTPRNLNDHMRFMVVVDANSTTPTVGSMNGVPYEFVSTNNQTEYNVPHNGAQMMVFVTGILFSSAEYDVSNPTKIVLNTPRNSGDVVKVLILQ